MLEFFGVLFNCKHTAHSFVVLVLDSTASSGQRRHIVFFFFSLLKSVVVCPADRYIDMIHKLTRLYGLKEENSAGPKLIAISPGLENQIIES